MPEGSWNGNSGAKIGLNSAIPLYDYLDDNVDFQIGGSYGLYNWNGHGNVVFANPKKTEQVGFVTAGVSSSYWDARAGLVYDSLYVTHYGIYDHSFSIDQLRFQGGYDFWCEEVGIWGTIDLTRAHKKALGVPVSYKAIGQMNLFWSHFFENCAETTLWIGMPYSTLR